MSKTLLLLSLLVLSSCIGVVAPVVSSFDDLSGNSTGANDIPLANIIGGVSFVEVGNQKYLFEGTMADGGRSSHNFEISLSLPDSEAASFSFYANRTLEQGVRLTLRREGATTTMTLFLNGVEHSYDIESRDVLRLSVDVHNDHEDAHILIWDQDGPKGDAEECVEEETCIYNTEFFTDPNPGPWGSQGRGNGLFWGYEGKTEFIIEMSGPNQALSNA